MFKKDTIFAVLISQDKEDIKRYENEVGFVNKDKGILINKMDDTLGLDYMRFNSKNRV